MILNALHNSDYSLYPNSVHIALGIVTSVYCGKRLMHIEFCLSEVQISKGKCLLTSFKYSLLFIESSSPKKKVVGFN